MKVEIVRAEVEEIRRTIRACYGADDS